MALEESQFIPHLVGALTPIGNHAKYVGIECFINPRTFRVVRGPRLGNQLYAMPRFFTKK